MQIGHIEGATAVIGKSQGYLGLPVKLERINCELNGPNTLECTTAWIPTPDEIEAIQRGAAVRVSCLHTQPPIKVFVGPIPE